MGRMFLTTGREKMDDLISDFRSHLPAGRQGLQIEKYEI
jgi:hypothetical protein